MIPDPKQHNSPSNPTFPAHPGGVRGRPETGSTEGVVLTQHKQCFSSGPSRSLVKRLSSFLLASWEFPAEEGKTRVIQPKRRRLSGPNNDTERSENINAQNVLFIGRKGNQSRSLSSLLYCTLLSGTTVCIHCGCVGGDRAIMMSRCPFND